MIRLTVPKTTRMQNCVKQRTGHFITDHRHNAHIIVKSVDIIAVFVYTSFLILQLEAFPEVPAATQNGSTALAHRPSMLHPDV